MSKMTHTVAMLLFFDSLRKEIEYLIKPYGACQGRYPLHTSEVYAAEKTFIDI